MIDQDIKKFVLRRLLQKNGEPLSATEIKLAIRNAFTVALVEGELDSYLTQMEGSNLVSFTRDELDQTLVFLTPKGQNAAQRLVKLS